MPPRLPTLTRRRRRCGSAWKSGELRRTPTAEWLLDGFFQRGRVTIVYGPTSVGKSQIAMALAGAAAYGQTWGDRAFTPGLAVYLCAENFAGSADRYRAWCRLRKIPDAEVDGITWFDGER